MRGLLRYRADRRTLCFVASYYAVFIAAWVLPVEAWWPRLALCSFFCVMTFFAAVICHNTIHCPVFFKRWHNRAFSLVLSWAFGSPASGFLPGHNLSHHRHLGTQMDNVRTSKVRFRWNLLNQALFFFVMVPGILRTESRYVRSVANNPSAAGWTRQYRLENAVLLALKVALLAIDPLKALLFVLVPNLYGVWGIFGTNFWQHDGCDERHQYNHSRSFVSPLLNFFCFNNGYHAVHHEKPGLHWSLLPAYHSAHYQGRCHPSLEQKSLLSYLVRTCLWPATRLTYDGRPWVPHAPGDDVDWVVDAHASGAANAVHDTELFSASLASNPANASG